MKADELSNRWNASDVQLIEAILLNGGRVDSVALPELPLNGNLLDLRGIQLPAKGFTPGVTVGASFAPPPPLQTKVNSVCFESVDFSYGNLSRRLIQKSIFNNVHFSKTNLEGISVHSTQFVRCTFDRTNLDGAGVGCDGTRYEHCLFKKLNFSKTSFGRAEFDDCRFEDCRFDSVDFFGSSFERCTFVGKVHDAWFRGHYMSVPDKPEVFAGLVKQFGVARPNKMKAVDFSHADLRDLTFSDECDLSTCKLPNDELIVGFSRWGKLLKAVEGRIPFMFTPDDGRVLEIVKSFDTHAQIQDWYIVNFRDFSNDLSLSVIERLKELFVEEAKKMDALASCGGLADSEA
jgi:fluoroquinolone resistance protein